MRCLVDGSQLAVCTLLFCSVAAASPNCPSALRIGIIDYELLPLVTATDKGAPPQGRAVDWIRQAVGRSVCNPELKFERMPARRGRAELARGSIDIWSIALPDAELHDLGTLPMASGSPDAGLGFYRSIYSLYVIHDEQRIHWDGKQLSGPTGLRVGIPPISTLEALARQHGWLVDKSVDTPNTLSKLLNNRHLAAVLPDAAIAAQPAAVRQRLQQLAPPVLQLWYYSAASKAFAARYPDFMHSYWLELCRVGRSSEPLPPCAAP